MIARMATSVPKMTAGSVGTVETQFLDLPRPLRLDCGRELFPIRIPMRHRFRRVDHREAVVIRGPAGWGEFSPFPDYPPPGKQSGG